MITTYLDSYKTLVFAKNGEDSDFPIGYLLDFVINPLSGKIEALWIRAFNNTDNLLLAPQDINYWNVNEIEISDETDLVSLENFPNIQNTLDLEVPLLRNNILTEKTNKKLGTVTNFSFDTNQLLLLSIISTTGFLFWKKTNIYLKKQIHKITHEGVFIKDIGLKIPIKDKQKSAEKLKKIPSPEFDISNKGSKLK